MQFPNIRYVPDKYDFLEKLCAGKRALHVGCADALVEDISAKVDQGRFLHARLDRSARELWGCDIDERALDQLRNSYGFRNLVSCDAQDMRLVDFDAGPFDVIVAAEVIEHMTNPGGFFATAPSLLADGGYLCVTTPNGALSIKTFLHSLAGREQVAPDHVVLFSFTSLATILGRYGYRKVQWFGALERHGSRSNRLANRVLEPLVRRFPFYADCLIALASA
jgi:2-polyprenyl-3-methyl-5-hydroxy-6-metoxy-1,4-benzoquinol methylase